MSSILEISYLILFSLIHLGREYSRCYCLLIFSQSYITWCVRLCNKTNLFVITSKGKSMYIWSPQTLSGWELSGKHLIVDGIGVMECCCVVVYINSYRFSNFLPHLFIFLNVVCGNFVVSSFSSNGIRSLFQCLKCSYDEFKIFGWNSWSCCRNSAREKGLLISSWISFK